MVTIQVGVLGAFELSVDGVEVGQLARMGRRVGTVLAGWPGVRVDRDRLVAALWDDEVPVDAVNAVQGHVSALRRAVGHDLVDADRAGYVLRVPAESVDAEAFVELVDRARKAGDRGDAQCAVDLLLRARGMWRGTPFREVFDADLVARRARLEETYEQVRELIVEHRLALAETASDAAELVGWAKEEVARAPARERRHVLLVRALVAAQRPAEARQAYRQAEAALMEHCGSKPGPQLRAVFPTEDEPVALGR